jgi:hypothetical protein
VLDCSSSALHEQEIWDIGSNAGIGTSSAFNADLHTIGQLEAATKNMASYYQT